jgi:predicted extracellular nuclease
VAVGDAVTLQGTVSEFVPGGASSNNLSTTQITNPAGIAVASGGNALPAPVAIGEGGRRPPTEAIEDDNFASFDPGTDGTDFYESLEAMRVTVQDAVAVAPTTDFGEIYAVADGGAGATNLSARGTVNIEGGSGGPP